MSYGSIVRVMAPIEAYQASHAEVEKTLGDSFPPGMLLHSVRATDEGFEIYEVWESKVAADTFNQEVVGPAIAQAGGDMSGPPPEVIEFEPAALMMKLA